MNNQVNQINAKAVLHDVMDDVCKYVNWNDLSNVAKVCKSWRAAVRRECNRRFYVQQLHLCCKIDDLANELYVNPSVSLLIYDSRLIYDSIKTPLPLNFAGFESNDKIAKAFLAKNLLEKFKKQLPNKVVVMGVDKHVTTFVTELLESDKVSRDFELAGSSEILGIFFPKAEGRVRLHFASFFSTCFYKNLDENLHEQILVDRLVEELGLNDCEPYPQSTIIQLAVPEARSYTIINKLCQRAEQKGKEITWSSIFAKKVMVNDCISNNGTTGKFINTAYLRLSGPSVESWSTVIHYLADREDIELKLRELQERVKRKRNYVGLFYAPSCEKEGCTHDEHPCGDSLLLVCYLNQIFPDIRFTGFFVKTKFYNARGMRIVPGRRRFRNRFVESSYSFKREYECEVPYIVSVIIISYD